MFPRSLLSAFRLFSFSAFLFFLSCQSPSVGVVRPEKIRSWREVSYPQEHYKELATLWEKYNHAYPSEDAYANWMYASRYAQTADFEELLAKGMKKYPANPTLLYLMAMRKPNEFNWAEPRRYLERAAELDPSYNDPWFMLVVNYMQEGNEARATEALQHLLMGNAITEEVLDYSYNTLLPLDSNAILVTNGDNDTYPAWILTRVVKHRPDVTIVNRSLMNTTWYPLRIISASGLNFTRPEEIEAIHNQTPPPWSDTPIVRLINAAKKAGRTVYFAQSLEPAPLLEQFRKTGDELGLVVQVTPSSEAYERRLQRLLTTWLKDYRTGGLDSWRLRNAKENDAGKMLVRNYGAALTGFLDTVEVRMPTLKPDLFRWYAQHVEPVLPAQMAANLKLRWNEER